MSATAIDLYCTVVSLVPFEIREEKPGLIPNVFSIPESDMKTPQVLKVGTARHYVYLDQDRGHLPVRTPSTEVANSIVRDYVTSQQRVGPEQQPALFWVPGDLNASQVADQFPDLVIVALERQRKWFTSVCQQADDDWAKYHRHTVVSDVQRKMAQILGWNPEQHEWMSPNTLATGANRCPACGTLAMLGAVVCSQCQCILDPEKYKDLQFAKGA